MLKQSEMEPSMKTVQRRNGIRSTVSLFVATVLSIVYTTICHAAEIPDYYSEPGINPYRSYINQDFAEHIDPFTGKLQLHYADLYLPGDGGFDIKVQRSYTSLDEVLPTVPEMSIIGMGWDISFGLMIKPKEPAGCANYTMNTDDNPVMKLADGSMEVFAAPSQGSAVFGGRTPHYISKNRWIAYCTDTATGTQWEVYSPNGLIYELSKSITSLSQNIVAVRKITDTNGNSVTFEYYGDGDLYSAYNIKPFVKTISASDGRQINFDYYDSVSAPYDTMRLKSISANGRTTQYDYKQVENRLLYRLTKVDLPGTGTGAWEYSYHINDADPLADIPGKYSVKSVKYPYGGEIRYTYDRNLYLQNDGKVTNGIKTKTTYNGAEVGEWTYNYTPGYESYLPDELDKTVVTMPGSVQVFQHYGLQSAGLNEAWKIGLLKKKITCKTGVSCTESSATQTETYTWDYQIVSQENFSGPRSLVDPDIRQPILTKKEITRDGSIYETQYSDFDDYGNARQVVESGNDTKTTRYTFYRNSANWIVNQAEDETIYDAAEVDGALVDATIDRTFDSKGNLITENNNGVVTDYTYYGNGNLETKTNARKKTTTYKDYYRGISRKEEQPEGITILRTVNDTGTVGAVTNGRSIPTGYGYDDLNRLSAIDYPINGDVVVTRTENTKTLSRGNFKQYVILDGFGREKSTDNSDILIGTSITVTKRYDALGRTIFESYPNSTTEGTSYQYDALDRLKQETHTDGSNVKFEYLSSNRVQITDELENVTVKQYRSYGDPDSKTLVRIESPEDVITVITRNRMGLAEAIWQGNSAGVGSRRSYRLNSKLFVKEEDNPETGTTFYGRDEVGNMTSKKVGSSGPTTVFVYDDQDRLDYIDYPDPTPDVDYIYDKNSNLKEVINSTSRRVLTYDENDNLTREDIVIESNAYTVKYDYDHHDNLGAMTYPTGRVAVYEPDALGRPTKLEPFVNKVTYHPSGQPHIINYNNEQDTTLTLNSRRWIETISSIGLENPIDLFYAYDYSGNVDYITNNLNSAYTRDMAYDGLNRLDYVTGNWGIEDYAYTETGDIKTINDGSNDKTFVYSDNKLSSITDPNGSISYAYDDYGNVTENATHIFYYDDAQNLTIANSKSGGSSFLFEYDGNNMRVVRNKEGKKTHFVYAASGQLLGAYRGDITDSEEYFYLGNEKVASAEIIEKTGTVAVPDITVNEGESVTLNAGARFSNGLPIEDYRWREFAGPPVALSSHNEQVTTFTAPSGYADYTIEFSLIVNNYTYDMHVTDTVRVHVKMIDADGDALSDSWEISHYGAIDVVSADSDTDGDGLTALEEFELRTDPTTQTAPEASLKVSAIPGNSSADITWTPGAYAKSYDLYWSQTPGVDTTTGIKIENATSPYHHTGLSNGTKYYYIVVARNNCCEETSAEVSVVPGINGWTTPNTLSSPYQVNTSGYSNNEFKVIWQDYGSIREGFVDQQLIRVESYSQLQGWGKTTILEADSGIVQGGYPDISLGKDGSAIAIWYRGGTLTARHYDRIAGWGEQYSWTLADGEANISTPFFVKHHGEGNATILVAVTLNTLTSATTSFYSIDFTPAEKWTQATLVKQLDNQVIHISDFTASQNGHMALFFSTRTEDRRGIAALNMMKRSSSGVWSDVIKISDNAEIGQGQAAINNHGNVAVAYAKFFFNDSGYEYRLLLWRDGPLPSETVEEQISTHTGPISTVIDDIGRITVAWMPSITSSASVQFPGDGVDELLECSLHPEIANRIYYRQYLPATGWSEEQRVFAILPGDEFCHSFLPNIGLTTDSLGDVHLIATATGLILKPTTPDQDPYENADPYRAVFDYELKYEEGIRYPKDIYPWYGTTDGTMPPTVAYGDDQGNMLAFFMERVDTWTSDPAVSEYVRLPGSPTANAGKNLETYGSTTVVLDASKSIANSGLITSYSWRQLHGASVALSDATAITPSFQAPTVTDKEVIWFELTVTNSNGLSDSEAVAVTVFPDTSNIVPVVGGDITVNKGATVTLDASATQDPNGVITAVNWIQANLPYVDLVPQEPDPRSDSIRWMATFVAPEVETDTVLTFKVRIKDAAGRVVYGYKNVTVKADSTGGDTTPPTITPAADLTVEATDILTPVDLGTASAIDDVDGALTPLADPTGPYALGAHTITWSATDAAGNTGTAQQTVTVQDTTAPTLTAPADISVSSNEPIAVTLGSATASDIFEPVVVTNDAPALFPVGTTTVNWTATDPNGNVATAQQTVVVAAADTSPPVVTAPPSISTEATATLTPVSLGLATAVDDVDGALTPTPDTSGPFALGTTSVIWSATDAAGNTGTATQQVVVVDTTPPTISPPGDVTVEALIPTVVDIGMATADDIFTPVLIENDAPAEFVPGETVVTWTATDANGNTATATQTVTIAEPSTWESLVQALRDLWNYLKELFGW